MFKNLIRRAPKASKPQGPVVIDKGPVTITMTDGPTRKLPNGRFQADIFLSIKAKP